MKTRSSLLLFALALVGCSDPVPIAEEHVSATSSTSLIDPVRYGSIGVDAFERRTPLFCLSRRYVVAYDDDFSTTQRTIIDEAVAAWSNASEGKFAAVRFELRAEHTMDLESCTLRFMRHDHPDPSNLGYTVWYSNADGTLSSSRTWIRTDEDDPIAFRAIAIHEVGHVLGLGHATRDNVNSCMWASVTLGCEITPTDKAQLCAIWGC